LVFGCFEFLRFFGFKFSDAVRSVSDGDGFIEMLMDRDFAFGKRDPEFRGLDLKDPVVPLDGVVASDGTLFFEREDQVEAFTTMRDKGRSLLFRRFYERCPVLREKGLKDIAIGIRNGFDAMEFDFVGQATLPCSEDPFGSTPCLRGIGRDGLNTELVESLPDLSEVEEVDFWAGRRSSKEVAGAIRIKGTKDPLGSDDMAQSEHALPGVLLRDEFGIIDISGGVISDHNEILKAWKVRDP